MANEFYQPIAYPTYQFATPYDPIKGAIDAYSAGLGIRQQKQQMEAQKQQMEMQKQQAEMQKQQMAMSQQRLDMETKRETRQARMAELDETLKKMEIEPKIELQSMFQAYQQACQQNPAASPEQRYKAAWQMAQQSKFPQTRETARKMIMMDMESRYPTPELQAQAETLIFGTPVTPEQVKMRDAKLVTGEKGAVLYSPKGEILSESSTARLKREEAMEAEELALKKAELGLEARRVSLAESRPTRTSTPGTIGGVKELTKDLKTLDQLLSQADKFKQMADLAETKPQDFIDQIPSLFGKKPGDPEVKKAQDIYRRQERDRRERAAALEEGIANTYTTEELDAAKRGNLGILQRVPGLTGDAPTSPYAKDKQNPLLPRPDEIKMPPKASVAASAPNPAQEMAALEAVANAPVDSPERRAARIRLAQLAQQGPNYRPPVVVAPVQRPLVPQPMGFGTKY